MKPDAKDHNPSTKYIRDLMVSTGMTQKALAERLGCTTRSLRYYATGERPCPYPVQFALEALVLAPD